MDMATIIYSLAFSTSKMQVQYENKLELKSQIFPPAIETLPDWKYQPNHLLI